MAVDDDEQQQEPLFIGVQRSCYSCSPYMEGFHYATKIRETNLSKNPMNPYVKATLEWVAFEDGFRDGQISNLFHFSQ